VKNIGTTKSNVRRARGCHRNCCLSFLTLDIINWMIDSVDRKVRLYTRKDRTFPLLHGLAKSGSVEGEGGRVDFNYFDNLFLLGCSFFQFCD